MTHEEKAGVDVFKGQMPILSWKVQIIEEVLQVFVVILQTEDFTGIPEIFE